MIDIVLLSLEERAARLHLKRGRFYHDVNLWASGSMDSKGCWWPKRSERRACCTTLKPPTRSYPHSLLSHCRTIRHCAALLGADEKKTRWLVGFLRKKGYHNRIKAEPHELETIEPVP